MAESRFRRRPPHSDGCKRGDSGANEAERYVRSAAVCSAAVASAFCSSPMAGGSLSIGDADRIARRYTRWSAITSRRYTRRPSRASAHRCPLSCVVSSRWFLECGLLCRGFAMLVCEDCDDRRRVAFSCKGRGWCPSCFGRRMAQTSANLLDHVLPRVPLRQFVLTVPFELRTWLAYARFAARCGVSHLRGLGARLLPA